MGTNSKLTYIHLLSSGNYKVAEADDVTRGTKIIIELNKDSESFSSKESVESNFRLLFNLLTFKKSSKNIQTLLDSPLS